MPVAVQRHTVDAAAVALEDCRATAGRDVPHAQDPVLHPAGDYRPRIGGRVEATDRALMTGETGHDSTVTEIHETHGAIATPAQPRLTSRGVGTRSRMTSGGCGTTDSSRFGRSGRLREGMTAPFIAWSPLESG